MTTPAGTLISSIARRVRDDSNTAHTRAFVRDILDRVQVIVNAEQEAVTLTRLVTDTANKTLYSVESDLQGIIDVQTVRINNIRLDEIKPWRNLYKLSATWLTDSAAQPQGWARIGRSLIAVYPAPQTNIEIEFQGTAITTPLTTDDVSLDVELEDEDVIREIVVALLLLRQRDLDVVEPVLRRIQGKLQIPELGMADKART